MIQKLPQSIKQRLSKGFLSPSVLIQEIDIRPGQIVLEIGRPIGFFASAVLAQLKNEGTFYVAGPNHESFEKLHHLKNQHANFEQILLSDILSGKLSENSVDTVVFTNLLSNTAYAHKFCLAVNQLIKPEGRLIVFDWDTAHHHIGPDMKDRYSKQKAIDLVTKCGLIFERQLACPGYHYGLVFKFGAD
ncbi:MAG: hypothetical protein Q8P54_01950 [bacterium]|nr:hypothetical protein [bacterium]